MVDICTHFLDKRLAVVELLSTLKFSRWCQFSQVVLWITAALAMSKMCMGSSWWFPMSINWLLFCIVKYPVDHILTCLFNFRYTDGYIEIFHWCFNSYFPNEWLCWTSFHILVHLHSIFLKCLPEVILIKCYWVVCLSFYWFRAVFYIFCLLILWQIHILWICSCSLRFTFHSLNAIVW